MSKVLFKLNHTCHRPGSVGSPGDVVEIDSFNADWLSEHGGGEIVDSRKSEKPKKSEPNPHVETATRPPAENAAGRGKSRGIKQPKGDN